MKKFTSLLLSIVLLLSLCAPASATGISGFEKKMDYKEGQFVDVPAGSLWSANVKTAYEFGLMNGRVKHRVPTRWQRDHRPSHYYGLPPA